MSENINEKSPTKNDSPEDEQAFKAASIEGNSKDQKNFSYEAGPELLGNTKKDSNGNDGPEVIPETLPKILTDNDMKTSKAQAKLELKMASAVKPKADSKIKDEGMATAKTRSQTKGTTTWKRNKRATAAFAKDDTKVARKMGQMDNTAVAKAASSSVKNGTKVARKMGQMDNTAAAKAAASSFVKNDSKVARKMGQMDNTGVAKGAASSSAEDKDSDNEMAESKVQAQAQARGSGTTAMRRTRRSKDTSSNNKVMGPEEDSSTIEDVTVEPGAYAVGGDENDSWSEHENDTFEGNDEVNPTYLAPRSGIERETSENFKKAKGAEHNQTVNGDIENDGHLIEATIVDDSIIPEAEAISENSLKRKRWFCCCIFISAVISIVLAVVLTREDSKQTEPTSSPTPYPTISPSSSPSFNPTSGIQAFLENLSPESIPALDDVMSAQYRALVWLENNHTDLLGMKSEEEILQRFVLATLFYATQGEQWIENDGWLTPNDECDWDHSYCEDGSIVRLEVVFNKLKGTIPVELGLLTYLKKINLSDNSITGKIPSQLGSMGSLTSLYLDGNSLSGTIPSTLAFLTDLYHFQLASNKLEGEVPSFLGELSKLRFLELHNNDLSGFIPTELGLLTSLVRLTINENRLEGPIPSQLPLLPALTHLALGDNILSGNIPFQNVTTENQFFFGQLQDFDVSHNFISGAIPTEIGLMSSARSIALNQNRLTGMIPSQVGNILKLEELSISLTSVTGSIPSEFGLLTGIESIFLENTDLAGELPSELGILTSLKELNFAKNSFEGPLPTEIGLLVKLKSFDLGGNSVSGELPSEMGMLQNLEVLSASKNQFSGSIPTEIGKLAFLETLSLSENLGIRGALPTEFGLMTNAESIALSGTFTGSIPSQIGALSKLANLIISGSSQTLTGQVPTEIGLAASLVTLVLPFNGLSGSLPSEIGLLENLELMFLIGNKISGLIPSELGMLTALRQMHLGSNKLTGAVPGEVCLLRSEEELLNFAVDCLAVACNCCSDSCSPNIQPTSECNADEISVQVVLALDQKPTDTNWSLIDSASGQTYLEGGSYVQSDAFTSIVESSCIPSVSCAFFQIQDSSGNGICCEDYGRGSYKVLMNGIEIVEGGEFEFMSEQIGVNACLSSSSPTGSIPPTASIAPSISPAPTFIPPECNDESVSVRVEITTDEYPEDNKWELLVDGAIVSEAGPYSEAESSFVSDLCVPLDSCIVFTIHDEYGDGLCCTSGEGGYALFVGGKIIASGGEFEAKEESYPFGTCS